MDRFEVHFFPYSLYVELYLHSSMDRFEVKDDLHSGERPIDLHSSMDRFEVLYLRRILYTIY